VTQAVSAAQKHQLEVWERHADLVLRPDVQSFAWDAFDRTDEAIEAGAEVTRRALPRIRKYLERAKAGRDGLETDLQNTLMAAEAVR